MEYDSSETPETFKPIDIETGLSQISILVQKAAHNFEEFPKQAVKERLQYLIDYKDLDPQLFLKGMIDAYETMYNESLAEALDRKIK